MEEENDQMEIDKPLSPILTGGKKSRKYLQYARTKSRVRLLNKFAKEVKIESIDNENRKTLEKDSIESANLEQGNQNYEKSLQPKEDIVFKQPLPTFQTANGKTLYSQDKLLKKSMNLFDDILHPKDSTDSSRPKKYNFLSKTQLKSDDLKNNQVYTNEAKVVNSFVGFKTASGGNIQIADSLLKSAEQNFGADMNSWNLSFDSHETGKDGEEKKSFELSSQETDQLFANLTHLEDIINEKSNLNQEESFKSDKVFKPNLHINQTLQQAPSANKTDAGLDVKTEAANSKSLLSDQILLPAVDISFAGFKAASGKKITISESALNLGKSRLMQEFESVSSDLCHSKQKHNSNFEDSTSLKTFAQTCETTKSDIESYSVMSNLEQSVGHTFVGFAAASGKKITISQSALKRGKSKLCQDFEWQLSKLEEAEETSTNDPTENEAKSNNFLPSRINKNDFVKSNSMDFESKFSGFKAASGKKVAISESALNTVRSKFDQEDLRNLKSSKNINHQFDVDRLAVVCRGFDKDAVEESRKYANRFLGIIEQFCKSTKITEAQKRNMSLASGFETASATDQDLAKSVQIKFGDAPDGFKFMKRKKSDVVPISSEHDETLTAINKNPNESLTNNTASDSFNSNVSFEDLSLSVKKRRLGLSAHKAFQQCTKNQLEKALHLFDKENLTGISPLKPKKSLVYNSTPLKASHTNNFDSPLTPIKNTNYPANAQIEDVEDCGRIVIRETTKGSVESWCNDLDTQINNLQDKLKMLIQRKQTLNLQQNCLNNSGIKKERKTGVLFDKKHSGKRIQLKDFITLTTCYRSCTVTPQNAELVHFISEPHLPFITTVDGASVIPNVNNLMGLSEIEAAFKTMPGVDSKLIPNGWIRNHFKWIVWKLASYELSTNLTDCLTLENVIQQLKYRYDREIDRAERSTLRRIYERDDAPQKRMVLCVSDIIHSENGKVELELSDGWYGIKTTVDDALREQVQRKKVCIGTKLITCGAELIGCDGCHPLDVTSSVRLKISCNSTRRALWHVKLGYQKIFKSFPVQLSSILPNGGLVGCIKVCVARVYPVKFLEKHNNLSVWRNKKAEQIRANEWEMKRRQEVDAVREKVFKGPKQNENFEQNKVNINKVDIKTIDCPETLYRLYENCNDPEGFQELMSASQQRSVVDFQQRISYQRQEQISRSVESGVRSIHEAARDVTPVLQLHVVDVMDPKANCVFQIWNPTESHLESIKESSVFCVYNVMPKRTGGLSATSKTLFKQQTQEFPEFIKHKRVLVPISQISDSLWRNEFDTVGLVVKIAFDNFGQNMWLADEVGSLLYIKVYDAPKNCLLFDKIESGHVVAVSNLIYCDSKMEFKEAIANHLTVVGRYPQHKHLQHGIDLFNKQFTKNLPQFLTECNKQIAYYVDKVDIRGDLRNVSTKPVTRSSLTINSDMFDDISDVEDSVLSTIDVDKYC